MKPRIPQSNNREQVTKDIFELIPFRKTLPLMIDAELQQWGELLPSQYNKQIMRTMRWKHNKIYLQMQGWFWIIHLNNMIHYLYGWQKSGLTHKEFSVIFC